MALIEEELRKAILERREYLAKEVGTEPACPFCKTPRLRRSNYVRCGVCGINWLDGEMNLPNYLNRNPSAARHDALMGTGPSKSAETSEGDADGK